MFNPFFIFYTKISLLTAKNQKLNYLQNSVAETLFFYYICGRNIKKENYQLN